MISWPISLDPQTHSAQTLFSTGVERNNPGAAASISDTFNYETRVSSNWSFSATTTFFRRTYGSYNLGGTTGPQEAQSDAYVEAFFLATTDSTSTASGIDRYGDTFTSGVSVSTRSILADTTTQTTRAYSFYPTATTLVPTTFYTSSLSSDSATTLTSATSLQSISIYGAQTTTPSSFTTTTTFTDEVVATPIFATVIEAEPGEVIWAVPTSAATTLTNTVQAASSAGTSTTRTTIYPWTATESLTFYANTDETTSQSVSAASTTITHRSTSQQQTTRASVADYNVLPNATSEQSLQTVVLTNTTASSTYFSESSVTFTKTTSTETAYFVTLSTASAYTLGSSYRTTTAAHSTSTRQYAPIFAETSTSSYSEEVEAYTPSEGTTTLYTLDASGNTINSATETFQDYLTYTWTATTYGTTTHAITTLSRQPQGMTTSMPSISLSREYKYGVIDSTGGVGLGYSAPLAGSAVIDLRPISRGASIVFPSVYLVSNSDASVTASVTISGLSSTYRAQSDTTTSSGLLSVFGDAPLGATTANVRSVMDASSIGASETIYQSLPRGAYASNGSSFSTTGKTSFSTQGGGSSAWLEPLSFVVPYTGFNSASPLWWTVSKSSHPELTSATVSDAYLAA